jgi:hypothetical protein
VFWNFSQRGRSITVHSVSVTHRVEFLHVRSWAVPGLFLVTLILLQGVASGATTLTPHPPAQYAVTHVGAALAPPVTLKATADAVATVGETRFLTAGTQAAGPGMAGVPTPLPTCGGPACRDRYIVASPAGLVRGDYAEQATYTVRQPVTPPGVSSGFLIELVVHMSTGWVFGRAYLATGTTHRAGGSTITLMVYLNLGTARAPTILSVHSVVDLCTSAAVCP